MEKNKVTLIRGAFINFFELQNYYPLDKKYNLRAVSSLHPISEDIRIPLTKTWSPTDLPDFPFKYQLLNRLFIDIHYLFGLEQILKGVDIAHTAETYYNYTRQAINAKKKGYVRRVVSTVWEVIPHNNEGICGRKYFKANARKNVDHFIAVTELAKSALIEEGVTKEKISVIPVGVDITRFKPAKKETKTLNILCVSRLVEEKGIVELLTSFNKLRTKYPETTLTIVGDGPLKKLISSNAGITVKRVPYHLIHKEYQSADIFCLASKTTLHWQEQFGMALVEAMASGLPIVTTNTGAISEVCGKNAFYAKPGDANDLQLKLERLVKDRSVRVSLGKRARTWAEKKYNSKDMAKKIDAIYQKVLWE